MAGTSPQNNSPYAEGHGMQALIETAMLGPLSPFGLCQQALAYWIDACQRQILYLDTLRQRGNAHLEQTRSSVPNVLLFDYEIVMDGRDLDTPVNYMLMRILPSNDTKTDPSKNPFIIFDPRAGHGLGISGMKEESEIGLALRAGHPCYLVGFLPDPVPGQTIEDVCEAEALFIKKVMEMHPKADSPCLIGNCQAGWQISMIAAKHPELVGVLVLAAAPLSFWAGVKGKSPIRYIGGLYGGAWSTAFTSDTGNGVFDGAMLVQGFENADPAKSLWLKHYDLYSKIDTEIPRFLNFEKWWSVPALLNKEEINFIVEDLFIGNRLSLGKIKASDGTQINLHNIKSPIFILCSLADDITPPQQALGWLLDLYKSDEEIAAGKQTIIYSLHKHIGHLGIFVSGAVAEKEHSRLINSMAAIKSLTPGLYEAMIDEDAHVSKPGTSLVMRFEDRRLENIRALGVNSREDDIMFTTASRISENLHGIYHTFFSSFVRAFASNAGAELTRKMHPVRSRYWMLSDLNPAIKAIEPVAEAVRKQRVHISENNPLWTAQETFAKQVTYSLETYKKMRDAIAETMFVSIYGNPFLQAVVGLRRDR